MINSRISNWDMRIISIVRSLEVQGLLIDFVTETVKGEKKCKKQQKCWVLAGLIVPVVASMIKYMDSLLLGNMIEKGVSKTEKRKKGRAFPSVELALF